MQIQEKDVDKQNYHHLSTGFLACKTMRKFSEFKPSHLHNVIMSYVEEMMIEIPLRTQHTLLSNRHRGL